MLARFGTHRPKIHRCLRLGARFYPLLIELRRSGNQVLRNVCPMTRQLTPASGREDDAVSDDAVSLPRADTHGALATDFGGDLGVRPGESDPGRMLAGVLVLVIATIIMALAWWLA